MPRIQKPLCSTIVHVINLCIYLFITQLYNVHMCHHTRSHDVSIILPCTAHWQMHRFTTVSLDKTFMLALSSSDLPSPPPLPLFPSSSLPHPSNILHSPQSINQSVNQSINQSINQKFLKSSKWYKSLQEPPLVR